MLKRGAKNLFPWIYNNRIRKKILVMLEKPTIISEIAENIRKIFELKEAPKISAYIEQLEKTGILRCLTPQLKRGKPGRIYDLSEKGIKIKKKICKKDNIPFIYKKYEDIDWKNYGWCLTGKQKTALVRVLDANAVRKPELVKRTKEFYKNKRNIKGITIQNIHDILQQMVKRGIVKIEIEQKKKKQFRKYKLSKKGLKIKEMIIS